MKLRWYDQVLQTQEHAGADWVDVPTVKKEEKIIDSLNKEISERNLGPYHLMVRTRDELVRLTKERG